MTDLLSQHLWQALVVGPLLLGALAIPVWHWSREWGPAPAVGLIAAGLLMLLLHANYVI